MRNVLHVFLCLSLLGVLALFTFKIATEGNISLFFFLLLLFLPLLLFLCILLSPFLSAPPLPSALSTTHEILMTVDHRRPSKQTHCFTSPGELGWGWGALPCPLVRRVVCLGHSPSPGQKVAGAAEFCSSIPGFPGTMLLKLPQTRASVPAFPLHVFFFSFFFLLFFL